MNRQPVWSVALGGLLGLCLATGAAQAQYPGSPNYVQYQPVQYVEGYPESAPCADAGGAYGCMDPYAEGAVYGGDCSGCGDCGGSCGPGFGGGFGGGLLAGGLGNRCTFGHAGYEGQPGGDRHGPLGDGGCCAPRWFDVHVEWMYMQREEVSEPTIFSARNILGNPVLGTEDLSLPEQSGFRLTGAYLIGPGANIEGTFFGTFNWADSAQVTGNGDLYSVFSNFGSDPFQGFLETDQADIHRIAFSTSLNNAEINVRRRWVSANCLVHSSLLMGIRYLQLRDDLRFFSQSSRANGGQLDYLVRTDNDLIGVQWGTDAYLCLTPRFKVGAEFEAGVYGVRSKQDTTVICTTCPLIREGAKDNDAAFISEASAIGLFRVTPRFAIRGGYTVLYVNGVALAAENFNDAPPFFARQVTIDNNGDALYHGANLGFEWVW